MSVATAAPLFGRMPSIVECFEAVTGEGAYRNVAARKPRRRLPL